MNNSIFRTGLRWVLLAVFLQSLTAMAQGLDGGVNSAMIKLFGDVGFTAQAEMKVMNSNHVVWLQMPGAFAGGNTKLRLDVDVKLIKSSSIPQAMIGMFVQAGKDRVTSVIRPDKKTTYIIYPGTHMYSALPLTAADSDIANQKLEKKVLGKETIDNHPCVKNQTTVKSAKGVVLLQANTWNATDLKDFPIQVELKENGNTTIMHFMNVNLVQPDPRLFEIPAGFKEEGASTPKPAGSPANKK